MLQRRDVGTRIASQSQGVYSACNVQFALPSCCG